MRMALSTPGVASSDSRQAVTSPDAHHADHHSLLAFDRMDLIAEFLESARTRGQFLPGWHAAALK